ncbi:hypothetical protein HKX48_000164 [Thoreauomyces humboldtii]|nr:hypothetical protein HKX48_000164 [Thoreauomyces humboldtii]
MSSQPPAPTATSPPAGIQVLYFTSARDATSIRSEPIPLPILPRTPVRVLIDLLTTKHPGLHEVFAAGAILAVNGVYVDIREEGKEGNEGSVGGGDEVAVVPPVSGG